MGLATAKILGADHRIVLADLNQERLDDAVGQLKTLDIDAVGVVCDITDRDSVTALFAEAERGGHVRAVVHTAGVSPQMGDAKKVVEINSLGTVNIAQEYQKLAAEGDALVLVASTAGHALPKVLIPRRVFPAAESNPDRFVRALVSRSRVAGKRLHSGLAYAMSKTFVIWYARKLAVSYGRKSARVLSVSPGTFDTAMGRLESDHGASDFLKVAALKRFGLPAEIGAVLAFCASEAPGYLTGVDILVDGGTKAGEEFSG